MGKRESGVWEKREVVGGWEVGGWKGCKLRVVMVMSLRRWKCYILRVVMVVCCALWLLSAK